MNNSEITLSNEAQNFSDEPLLIDLDKIIRNQHSKLLRQLPQFVKNYLKNLIRQDEVNRQLLVLKDKYGLEFIQSHIEYLNISVNIKGYENLPESGRFIIVCNHPLGAVDFYAALIACRNKYPVVKALANDILLNFRNLKSLFLPVNAFGRSPEEYHKLINQAYSSDIQIITFPSGEVSRKRNGEIKDGEWHRSFVRNAIEHKRDVIPFYIHAKNSNRFYRWGNYRKKLGIKVNLELFLLPDELFKQKDKTIELVIGKPIPFQYFNDSKSHLEWAQVVKEEVYALKSVLVDNYS